MKRRVAITGIGCVTSLGHNVQSTWSNIKQGVSGVTKINEGDSVLQNKRPYNLALVKNFDYQRWKIAHANSRMNNFLHAACDQALKSLGLDLKQSDVVGINIGTMSSNITKLTEFVSHSALNGGESINRLSMLHILGNIPGSTLSVKYKLRGPISTTSAACATGLASIGDAYNWILNNDADFAIAGGVQDVYNSTCLYSSIKLQTMTTRQDLNPQQVSRPFDKQRSGFVLGEGAGVVILQSYENAMKRKAKIYGQIIGYGCYSDGYHLTQPDPLGSGAYKSMQISLKKAGVKIEQIDHINCHATSTPVGDQAQVKAIQKLFGNHKITLTALKSYFGHSFGAAGSIQLIMGLKSMQQNLGIAIKNLKQPLPSNLQFLSSNKSQPIKYFLKNAFGFGGVNCSMLIKKHE